MVTQEEILELQSAAVRLGLANQRQTLLAGINLSFVANIPLANAPGAQFVNDLNAMNEAGQLTDGSRPLAIWLGNAAQLAGPRPEGEIFDRILARILIAVPPTTEPPEEPVAYQRLRAWIIGAAALALLVSIAYWAHRWILASNWSSDPITAWIPGTLLSVLAAVVALSGGRRFLWVGARWLRWSIALGATILSNFAICAVSVRSLHRYDVVCNLEPCIASFDGQTIVGADPPRELASWLAPIPKDRFACAFDGRSVELSDYLVRDGRLIELRCNMSCREFLSCTPAKPVSSTPVRHCDSKTVEFTAEDRSAGEVHRMPPLCTRQDLQSLCERSLVDDIPRVCAERGGDPVLAITDDHHLRWKIFAADKMKLECRCRCRDCADVPSPVHGSVQDTCRCYHYPSGGGAKDWHPRCPKGKPRLIHGGALAKQVQECCENFHPDFQVKGDHFECE